jgi:uncharacterized membrane protein YeaQ/YmgE (transglycosylase-associated protein family)
VHRVQNLFRTRLQEGKSIGLLRTIVLGLVIGLVAELVHPGKQNTIFILTVLLGIARSFPAGIIEQLIGGYKA